MLKYGIILPVKNGGHYVKECIRSILSQTIPSFNLLVLDNSSTDGTREWIESLKDERVLIYPSGTPLTIEQNWARITSIPKNEFITLIGHDDVLKPGYLAIMDDLIRRHPLATLYQTHFNYINANGFVIRSCKPMDEIQSAGEFLSFFLSNMIDTMGTGFMMRSSDYDAIGGIPPRYANLLFADFELFINLARKGYKATSFEHGFSFRLHDSMTTTSSDNKFHNAFSTFIDYLTSLKTDAQFDNIIKRYALNFLSFYSRGLSHRLLRTPIKIREGRTVTDFLSEVRSYADKLVPGNNFRPEQEFSVKLARRIDDNFLSRRLFLLFKKMRPAPVY